MVNSMKLLKQLASLANSLDNKGAFVEANMLDEVLRSFAQPPTKPMTPHEKMRWEAEQRRKGKNPYTPGELPQYQQDPTKPTQQPQVQSPVVSDTTMPQPQKPLTWEQQRGKTLQMAEQKRQELQQVMEKRKQERAKQQAELGRPPETQQKEKPQQQAEQERKLSPSQKRHQENIKALRFYVGLPIEGGFDRALGNKLRQLKVWEPGTRQTSRELRQKLEQLLRSPTSTPTQITQAPQTAPMSHPDYGQATVPSA